MRCKTCQRTQRVIDKIQTNHHWSHQQCSKCHYLGKRDYTKHVSRYGEKIERLRSNGKRKTSTKYPKNKVMVDESNVNLYLKLSEIIRGKKNLSKKQIIKSQLIHNKRNTFP